MPGGAKEEIPDGDAIYNPTHCIISLHSILNVPQVTRSLMSVKFRVFALTTQPGSHS